MEIRAHISNTEIVPLIWEYMQQCLGEEATPPTASEVRCMLAFAGRDGVRSIVRRYWNVKRGDSISWGHVPEPIEGIISSWLQNNKL